MSGGERRVSTLGARKGGKVKSVDADVERAKGGRGRLCDGGGGGGWKLCVGEEIVEEDRVRRGGGEWRRVYEEGM